MLHSTRCHTGSKWTKFRQMSHASNVVLTQVSHSTRIHISEMWLCGNEGNRVKDELFVHIKTHLHTHQNLPLYKTLLCQLLNDFEDTKMDVLLYP